MKLRKEDNNEKKSIRTTVAIIIGVLIMTLALPMTASAATATSNFKCSSSSYPKYAPKSLYCIDSRVYFVYDNGIIYDDVTVTLPRIAGQTYKVSITMTATNGKVATLNKTVNSDTKYVGHVKLPNFAKCKTVKATIKGTINGSTDTWTINGK